MLRHLGLVPHSNTRRPASDGNFPFAQGARQEVQPSDPNIIRWAREQREQEALRKRFPQHFPPRAGAKSSLDSYPKVLPERVKAFLSGQQPSTDWSKVVTRIGGNRSGSTSSADHNVVSFSKPFENDPVEFFHEMGHIPDWLDGSLTKPKYVGQALLSGVRNALKNTTTYGMFASTEAPKDPEEAIWEDISYEKAAAKRGKRWVAAWRAKNGNKIR